MSETPEKRVNDLLNERQNWQRIMSRIKSDLENYEDHLRRFPESRSVKRKINSLNKQLDKYSKILDKVNEEITELVDKHDLTIQQLRDDQVTRPVVTSVEIRCNRCGSLNVRTSFNEKTMTAKYECLTCGNMKEVKR